MTLSFRHSTVRWIISATLCAAGSTAFWWKRSPRPQHPPQVGSPAAANPRLTIAEKAAMAVLGGVEAPTKPKLPDALRKSADGTAPNSREQALLNLLENGMEAEAAGAIRGLAALGGTLNWQRLAAIAKDSRWSDALRTEAARALLTSDEPADALLGTQALALLGGEANTDRLTAMVNNPSLPASLRLEAALGMATIGTPRARETLVNALAAFPEPENQDQLLHALGNFPFPQIEATIQQVLANPNSSDEARVAAVDALAASSPEALPFLKKMAESDRDPRVREMSAWAISALPSEDSAMGSELVRLASAEPEADVRRRLYEALPTQQSNPAERILPLIEGETDLAAKVAGFNALGDSVKRGGSPAVAAQFDTRIIPELTQIAVSDEPVNIRMRAVFALRRAGTAAARDALQVISRSSNQKVAVAALHGLQLPK